MSDFVVPQPRAATPFHARPAPPSNYAPIPQRLITDLHRTPLAIGLYALIGRLFLVAQEAMPLSVPDVMRYDPTLSRGALIRAFNRLVGGGWLIEARERGRKTRYVPTWGRVHGTVEPWRADQPRLGRPRHIKRLPLDRALLDVCMGKLTPHPLATAPITRYITVPVLSLVDVGCYALTLAGLPRETPALGWIGAVHNGQPCPLPDEMRLLARISQRTLVLDRVEDRPTGAELTLSGSRRFGLVPRTVLGNADNHARPLFFVPPGVIGSMIQPMIGTMIGQTVEQNEGQNASASVKTRSDGRFASSPWEWRENRDKQHSPLPPQEQTATASSGGGAKARYGQGDRPGSKPCQDVAQDRQAGPLVPDTEATRALSAINVLPEQLIELAHLPIETVQAALADGKARDGVRDLAGWVVKLLRNHRDHGWKIVAPAPRADAPEALRAAFARYATAQEADAAAGAAPETAAEQVPTVTTSKTVDGHAQLWQEVHAMMKGQTTRQEWNTWLRCLNLTAIEGGIATITAPNARVKETIERRYLVGLRAVLCSTLGEPLEVRVLLCAGASPNGSRSVGPIAPQHAPLAPQTGRSAPLVQAAGAEAHDRPSWICMERWQALPSMLRAALLGSTLVDGAVQARSPYLAELLATRYARERDELISSAGQPSREARATEQRTRNRRQDFKHTAMNG